MRDDERPQIVAVSRTSPKAGCGVLLSTLSFYSDLRPFPFVDSLSLSWPSHDLCDSHCPLALLYWYDLCIDNINGARQ